MEQMVKLLFSIISHPIVFGIGFVLGYIVRFLLDFHAYSISMLLENTWSAICACWSFLRSKL